MFAQPSDVLSISIAELASRVGVGQPTVACFVGALGFSEFKEFKLRLAQSLATGVPFIHRDASPDDAASDVSRRALARTIAALMGIQMTPTDKASLAEFRCLPSQSISRVVRRRTTPELWAPIRPR